MHNGKPLVYLDNAATTQKPQVVLDAINHYYRTSNSNVHRGAHTLAAEATLAYEQARNTVASFIGAHSEREIVFTRGTTESINLVATSWGSRLTPGSKILVTEMEHHSNIVPWQMVAQRTGATVQSIPVADDGSINSSAAIAMMDSGVAMVACTHVSNTMGTINNVQNLCAEAAKRGITTLVDGAQAVAHLPVNVADIGCDFYVFSGHKLYGPTGIGVLYGKEHLLNSMSPYQGGGSMIAEVTIEHTTFLDAPQRFEAGTPNIAGAVGLAAAINWYVAQDHAVIERNENEQLAFVTEALQRIDGLRIIGTSKNKIGVLSFVVHGMHAHDVGMLLDEQGVAIRTGHHCTQPLMNRFGVTSTARMSVACYTTMQDVEQFVKCTRKAVELLVS